METMEIWKEVRGHLDYAISTLGRVRRLTKGPNTRPGLILKLKRNRRGYLQVGLCRDGKLTTRLVHILVGTAFLWPRPGLETNHKNGDKIDNRLANLELVTHSENGLHAYRTGLRGPVGAAAQIGEQVHNAKLSENAVREIRGLRADGLSLTAIGERFGVSPRCIGRVLSGETWAHVV